MNNPRDRRYERLERSALEGELNRWGKWIEDHSDYEGYPGANILIGFLQGRGGGTAGHRILCLDMPVDVYAVHARVIGLPEGWQEALWIYYVTRLKADGTLLTVEERCEKIGISDRTLRRRLTFARRRLMGLPDEACEVGLCQVHSMAS